MIRRNERVARDSLYSLETRDYRFSQPPVIRRYIQGITEIASRERERECNYVLTSSVYKTRAKRSKNTNGRDRHELVT